MITRLYFGVLLSTVFVIVSGGTDFTSLWAQSPISNESTEKGQLAVVEGVVEMKPKGSSEFCSVSMGARFRRGDLLKVASSAKAVVVCSDATKHELKYGVHGLPCKPASSGPRVMHFDGAWVKLNPTRGESSDSNIPIIISPRKTKLLDPSPMLRWTPVADASNYIVSVRGLSLDWKIDVGSKTEFPYPQDKNKQLTPGRTYKLTVETNGHSSDEESVPGLGFTLLTPLQAQIVRNAQQKITALGLSEIATKQLIAQLYAESKLNAEAIEQLRNLPVDTTEPVIAQLLGDLYLTIGLNNMAEDRYLLALKLAKQKNDPLSQAHTQYSLGQVYEMLGNKDEAIKYWRQAKEIYEKFMSTEITKEIEAALARLQGQ